MEMLRRSMSWSFALIAAISLTLAGIWGAQVALVALRRLMLFNFTLFVADVRATIMLAAVAVLAGTCAILTAPPRAIVIKRTIVRHQRQRDDAARETLLKRSLVYLAHLLQDDTRTRDTFPAQQQKLPGVEHQSAPAALEQSMALPVGHSTPA
jgi:hypothetical protein